jgi:F-type H+-transporting ATPase subunit alpha
LQQRQYEPLPVSEQIAAFVAVTGGVLDDLPVELLPAAERAIRRAVVERTPAVSARIQAGKKLSDEDFARILRVARQVMATLEGDV